MEKIAIFVEGHTERIFVREYLLRKHEYSNLSLKCFQLEKEKTPVPAEYDYPCPDPTHEYQLTCVGNDDTVIEYILEQENYLSNKGFTKIIGLRDMFSKKYKKYCAHNQVDIALNDKFINAAKQTVQERAANPNLIQICYAVMEIEAWFLEMYELFEFIDKRLTKDNIGKQLNWDIDKEAAEYKFLKPANEVETLYSSVDKTYNKSQSEVAALLAEADNSIFDWLYQSGKSASFKNFVDILAA